MRGRTLLAVGVGVAVAATVGAGMAVGAYLSGGGTQPEDVLPDSVVAFADVDLDPAADQKVDLVRLLGRFPDVEDAYGSDLDLREVMVDALVEGTDLESAQVEQWLGDRVGVGLSWDEEQKALTPVAAIQTTDEDEALADLGGVLDAEQLAVTDGYVVVVGDLFEGGPFVDSAVLSDVVLPDSATAADLVTAGQEAPLAEAPGFREVFEHLDDGLVTGYVDGTALSGATETFATDLGLDWSPTGTEEVGLAGAVLRAEPNALELLAWSSSDPTQGSATPAALVAGLPESTLMALEVTDGADLVAGQWQSLLDAAEANGALSKLERELAAIEAEYGIVVPDDVQTLLGDDAVLAVDGEGLLTGLPGVGVRSVTDPAAGADLARRLEDALAPLTGGFGVTARPVDDGMVVATSGEFADQLAAGDGALGDAPLVTAALPDLGEASSVLWLDLAAIGDIAPLAAPEAASVLDPLAGLGVTATPDDGGVRVRLRVVFEGGT